MEKEGLVKTLKESIEKCFAEVEKNKTQSEQYLDNLLRLKAEFENYKKRSLKERDEYIQYSSADIIAQLLPIIEHLERGLEGGRHAAKPDEILRGMQMILKELEILLKKNGVTQIESKGKKFDPGLHEVMGYAETKDFHEDTVIEELQKGYKIYDKVLRHAKVRIAKKPQDKAVNKEISQQANKEKITEEDLGDKSTSQQVDKEGITTEDTKGITK
jgi:molecular chaperone GrpE